MRKYFDAVRPYLEGLELLVVASSHQDQPWCAMVYFVYDEDLNFYFFSRVNRRHSEEIARNPKASISLARQIYKMGDASKGIQAQGLCKQLASSEVERVLGLYLERFPQAANFLHLDAIRAGTSIERIWQFTPEMIKVYDVDKYAHDGRELRA